MSAELNTEVSRLLEELEYKSISKWVFKNNWNSHSIEHYIFFQSFGVPKEFLSMKSSLCNSKTENFSRLAIKKFGPPLYKIMKTRKHHECTLIREFTFDKKDNVYAIYVPEYSIEKIVDKLKCAISYDFIKFVKSVNSQNDLLSILKSDGGEFAWYRSNCAIRAAQIVYLSIYAGLDRNETINFLMNYSNVISKSIGSVDNDDTRNFLLSVSEFALKCDFKSCKLLD